MFKKCSQLYLKSIMNSNVAFTFFLDFKILTEKNVEKNKNNSCYKILSNFVFKITMLNFK